MQSELRLRQGRFYVDRDGFVWCCYSVSPDSETHSQAHCIRLSDHRTEYFYRDGRYDTKGERSFTLLREVNEDEYEGGYVPTTV